MHFDNSGVPIAEDALSTCYSPTNSSYSSVKSAPLTRSATSASSSSSLSTGDRHEGGFLNYFRRRSWFGFGATVDDSKKKQDADTVTEIIKCFRNNDIDGMEKFTGDGTGNVAKNENSTTQENGDNTEVWWNDEEFAHSDPVPKNYFHCKYTPHPKKGISKLPPRVLKAVRFNVEHTPEDRESRPFTPLFTSTPKHPETGNKDDSDSDDELPPLRDIDSNTVLPPTTALNNTSSILLANISVMASLKKCRQETQDAICLTHDNKAYKICYDDTDEEEVVEEEEQAEEAKPTPSRCTFVVSKEESEPSSNTISIRDQSFDHLDTSTDSSVVLGLDCIDNYIQRLDDEIAAANRYAREKDLERAIEAVRHARHLQERFGQMNEAINEMCSKLPNGLEQSNDISAEDIKQNISAAFEDSRWEAQLGSDAGSFDESLL